MLLEPGADPASIRFDFEGVPEVSVDPAGNLVGRTSKGSFELRKPTVYQEASGVRMTIEGVFSVAHGHTVGFRLGAYDRSLPLVIDPVLVFSTFLGGSSADTANAIAIDPAHARAHSYLAFSYLVGGALSPSDDRAVELGKDFREYRHSND
jgi:hypothetical protein